MKKNPSLAAINTEHGIGSMPKAVSLFSGCGGSDAGVTAAGFDVVMANDVLAYARDVYLSNHPETDYVLGDVAQIESFPGAQLLVGCYPCQGFSQGGVRDPGRKINTLYLEFARALTQIKPKAFIVENVSGMVRKNFSHLLTDQIKVFSEAGYSVKYQVLNAADYGVAQERKRIFIVGTRSDLGIEYQFPAPTHAPDARTTIAQALHGMEEWPEGEFYDREFHWYYLSRDRRRDWHEVSKTIVANPRHMPLHPMSPKLIKREHNVWEFEHDDARKRRFSYKEAARLQGFVPGMIFPDTPAGSLDMRYKVVGNAVPPPLFEAVAKALPDVWD
ncbi:DNA cytosine methyltransferase [Limnohabitans sp. WS1]|uniref:DNA cytosine methyltransferase n=1 Tax=Limnohabitans sp. WS1 TaxID=1100726 RepID=UPI001E613551|nr:DNA cytosine methyltransferase [Limnohabitans sp. WS1]